jgi:hypothetical protein
VVNVNGLEDDMTDSVQGAYNAGILATGDAGVESTEEDEQANADIVARLAGSGPVNQDADGTPVGASDAAEDAARSDTSQH